MAAHRRLASIQAAVQSARIQPTAGDLPITKVSRAPRAPSARGAPDLAVPRWLPVTPVRAPHPLPPPGARRLA